MKSQIAELQQMKVQIAELQQTMNIILQAVQKK